MPILDEQIASINQTSNDIDQVYHDIAQHFELTDNIYWIFYILHDASANVTQADLSHKWSFSKKTVNSSVSAMVKKGWISLDLVPGSRKLKALSLTSAGQALCERAIGLTKVLEQVAYDQLSADEREQLVTLFNKLNVGFQVAVNELMTAKH